MIEDAVNDVLDAGIRTADINQLGKTLVSTSEMGSHILGALTKLNN